MHAAVSRRARTRWASLYGRDQGERDARRPIVLLHGLTFDHRMWDPVLAALAPGQHAIAFDLPGHGGSPSAPEAGLMLCLARHGVKVRGDGRLVRRAEAADDARALDTCIAAGTR